MDKYFNTYREMISLRGLSDHTLKSYCTYIRSYLDYLSNILHRQPEDVSWADLRDYIRWLQKERNLSDRTVNHAISQLRFFTMYVLHKPCCTFNVMQWMARHEAELGWEHRLTCHSFRHAFGTHLYENRTDLLTIKHLMGHKSLHSTLIYIHLASYNARNVSSPFDRMGGILHV